MKWEWRVGWFYRDKKGCHGLKNQWKESHVNETKSGDTHKKKLKSGGVPPCPLPIFPIILYDLLGIKPSTRETGLYSLL